MTSELPNDDRRANRGMTLVELLVLLIVIVVLIGLLLPAVQHASISRKGDVLLEHGAKSVQMVEQVGAGTTEEGRLPRKVLIAKENASHIVYPIYFGTNRIRMIRTPAPLFLSWLKVGGLSALAVVALCLLFAPLHPKIVPIRYWLLAIVIVTMILTWAGLYVWQNAYRAQAKPQTFSAEEDDEALHYGICNVSIPITHRVGNLETPSILLGEFRENPDEHIVLQRVQVLRESAFMRDVSKSAEEASWRREALVFIHGFNVSFEDAARSAAQLSFDSRFGGVSAFFSWPSQGSFRSYDWDEQTVKTAEDDFRLFLTRFTEAGDFTKIYIVAHSMGNRCLSNLLASPDFPKELHIEHCIMAAPDVDLKEFEDQIAPKAIRNAKSLTLYASKRDRAMDISEFKNGRARLGDANPIAILEGIESVDASDIPDVGFSNTGHSYVFNHPKVVADIDQIFETGLPAKERNGLQEHVVSALMKYWSFKK